MRRSAGLPLSVGKASAGTRIFLASVLLVVAGICTAGGIVISSHPAGRIIAVTLVIPLAAAALIAATYVLAPWSRFGVWLDHALPQLGKPGVAVATAMLLWILAFVITWKR